MRRCRAFLVGDDGVALTEYLVLLGVVVAALVAAVSALGNAVGGGYERAGQSVAALLPQQTVVPGASGPGASGGAGGSAGSNASDVARSGPGRSGEAGSGRSR